MIVLAFDTSVTGCAVCVFNGHDYWTETLETERGQAEMLVPLINKTLDESGYSFSDIDRIGVTTGPGSFTGLRVSLSTARALALTIDKPLLGFSTLEVLANNLPDRYLVLIDTKRGDFYGQIFVYGQALEAARIWTMEEVEGYEQPVIKNTVPDIKLLAQMTAAAGINGGRYDALSSPQPVYLRGAEISQSKRVAPKIVIDENSEMK